MKVFIIPNFQKQKTAAVFKETVAILGELGAETIVTEQNAGGNFGTVMSEEEAFAVCDAVIAIGGDGSIIHAAKKASGYGKALLGINCGRVGYLSGLESGSLGKLKAFVNGEYSVENRNMMCAEFVSDGKRYKKEFLNDAVVSKGTLSRIIDVGAEFSDSSVHYRADGVIVSTPTGSTAYSMAAGGPIVAPELDVMIITPISAHSFQNRSIVLGAGEKIELVNESEPDNEVYISIDGEESYRLNAGARVAVKRAERTVKLIRIENKPFFKTLANKII